MAAVVTFERLAGWAVRNARQSAASQPKQWPGLDNGEQKQRHKNKGKRSQAEERHKARGSQGTEPGLLGTKKNFREPSSLQGWETLTGT